MKDSSEQRVTILHRPKSIVYSIIIKTRPKSIVYNAVFRVTSMCIAINKLKKLHRLFKGDCFPGNTIDLMIKNRHREEQGWHSGGSTCLPPMWPGFNSRSRRHMWVEFVVGSRPCSEDFSPGSPVFLPPKKKQHFQFPIRPGTHVHLLNELREFFGASWVNKLHLHLHLHFLHKF